MTSPGDIKIEACELTALVTRLFTAAGVPSASAKTVAASLVDADLEGQASHGVMLVDMYLNRIRHSSVSLASEATVVEDRNATVVLDAGNALGQLTGDQAIELAVARARRYGAGIVTVRNGFHFGTARRFALAAAAADCIGIAMCNTRPLMPAVGGAQAVVGNNPIAVAIPSDEPVPLVLDMATSAAAMGRIRMAAKSKEPIPPSWAVASDGSPTTDPVEAIGGMLLPFGGPKGFGIAFMIDLLCGLLSGGGSGADVTPLYGDPRVPYNAAHLFMAIDLAHFGDPAVMKARAGVAARHIRAGAKAPGVAQLYTPGEPEWRTREASAGVVTLTPAVASMLCRMASELNVSAAPIDIKPE